MMLWSHGNCAFLIAHQLLFTNVTVGFVFVAFISGGLGYRDIAKDGWWFSDGYLILVFGKGIL
jgi:hypothetical protein